MPFPRRLLIEGEELVLDLRPHPIALARAILLTLLVIVAWILLLPRLPFHETSHTVLTWITWGVGVLILLIWPLRDTIRYLTSHFVVTSDRVIHRAGWIAKRSMEIPLEAINDVRFEQNVFERMIGAGTLLISSASTKGTEVFEDIRKPEAVQKEIYRMGELNQQRMSQGRGQVVPSAPSTTTELQRLSELRDKGVLTEEEFQAQKKKILGP
jgi:uncharacterized membrane protein YdbT with pleckstrin-like domain